MLFKTTTMKNISLLLILIALTFSCDTFNENKSPEIVYASSLKKISEAENLQFNSQFDFGNQRVVNLTYKIQKASYEPHLNYFLYKEMDEVTKIYYKLASLAVVEDHKERITIFDYENDRSIPRYLEAYTQDEDNLITVGNLLETHKNSYVFLGEKQLKSKNVFLFEIGNRAIWIDAETSLPVKLALNPVFDGDGNLTEQSRLFTYEQIDLNPIFTEDTFTHTEKEGYISSVYNAKTEPLLNQQAKEWTLLDLSGNQVSLSDFKRENIFIEAWVSSCEYCIRSIPKVKKIESDFGNKLKVVTINFDYDLNQTKQSIIDHKINYSVLFGNSQFDKEYDIRSFPSYYVIDRAGKIIYTNRGAIDGRKEKELFEALKGLK